VQVFNLHEQQIRHRVPQVKNLRPLSIPAACLPEVGAGFQPAQAANPAPGIRRLKTCGHVS